MQHVLLIPLLFHTVVTCVSSINDEVNEMTIPCDQCM